MRDLDRMIDEALDTEERELLRSIGEEPGLLGQTMGVFRGRTGWVHVVLMIVQTVTFIAGVWAAWNFFSANDALAALRWGLPAVTLMLMSLTIKMAMWPTIQADRVIRELKRIELQLAHGFKA